MNEAASNGQPAAGADPSPGGALLAERRRQNLSLGDVSRQLKLSVRQVEALERDDFSGFQGPVFVHGFIRNYAKLLGLDPNPMIRAADRLLNPVPAYVEPEPVVTHTGNASATGRSMWPMVAGAAVVVLVAGLVYLNSRSGPAPTRQPASTASEQVAAGTAAVEKRQSGAKPTDKPAADRSGAEKPGVEKHADEKIVAAKPAEKPAPASQNDLPRPISNAEAGETGPRMTIRMIFDQDSWVEIKDRSGNTVFGQLNAAGTRRSASGEPPLTIVVGNAAGVRLFRGDKTIDLAPHTRVDVARLTVE
jgi:cytoskeleton protein RodZ